MAAAVEDKSHRAPSGSRRSSSCVELYVKRILRHYGYVPDKQERATQLVLEQAEVLPQAWE